MGGHIANWVGTKTTTIFDPTTNSWTDVQPMTYGRWYPTLTKLPDGRMLAVSGAIDCPDCGDPNAAHNGIAQFPEVSIRLRTRGPSSTGAGLRLPMYPHMYVLRTGACSRRDRHGADREPRARPRHTDVVIVDSAVHDGGASAMYLPGKIIKTGSAWEPDYRIADSKAERGS